MIVTTAHRPADAVLARAEGLARELGARLVARRGRTLRQLMEHYRDPRLLVVSDKELRYYDGDTETPFYFHPSMAFVRVKRLRNGEPDPMIELSGCEPGDSVLDCTAGLGSDALVFSYAVGQSGRVTALESEPVLHVVVREGWKHYETDLPDANEAMRRIDARLADHREYLAALPDDSVDIIYFDPMFREPVYESSALEPIRPVANYGSLERETVGHAIRVARKCVMMKESRTSDEFERLGFERCPVKKTSKIGYGVIRIDRSRRI